jgi:N-acetylmuramoyl-L-alanine amidase
MNIIKKTSPHKSSRGGHKVTFIVIHISTSTLSSMDSWFSRPESKVSAHYGVGKDGRVHQYVEESLAAWHAGTVVKPTAEIVKELKGINPNKVSIGIEHEGKATDVWTEPMYQSSGQLIADISRRHNISIDYRHIIPHRSIRSDKTCPGNGVDLSKLLAIAQAYAKCGAEKTE